MAGTATVTTTLAVTGIGDSFTLTNTKAVTVPVEERHGYVVLATAGTTALQLFDAVELIALAKIYLLYIKAVSGTVYILPDTAGTATFAAAAADLVLLVGESAIIPINPAGNLGCTIDADGVTAAIEYCFLGKA